MDKFAASGPVKRAVISTATGDTTLVAAVAGKTLRVLAVVIVPASAVTIRFESGTGGTALTGQMSIAANALFTLPFNPAGWCETAAAALLNLEQSGTVALAGVLLYQEIG